MSGCPESLSKSQQSVSKCAGMDGIQRPSLDPQGGSLIWGDSLQFVGGESPKPLVMWAWSQFSELLMTLGMAWGALIRGTWCFLLLKGAHGKGDCSILQVQWMDSEQEPADQGLMLSWWQPSPRGYCGCWAPGPEETSVSFLPLLCCRLRCTNLLLGV